MPVIFFKEKRENPLEMEPYKTFDKKFEDKKDDLEDAVIKVGINNRKSGFHNGFGLDKFYSDDISMSFEFSMDSYDKGKSESQCLIHHTIEYDFDGTGEIQNNCLGELEKRAGYLYVPHVDYIEYGYKIGKRQARISFDLITSSDISVIREVCRQMISLDIAIFSRGW